MKAVIQQDWDDLPSGFVIEVIPWKWFKDDMWERTPRWVNFVGTWKKDTDWEKENIKKTCYLFRRVVKRVGGQMEVWVYVEKVICDVPKAFGWRANI
jgi:hypothetical protein